MAKASCLLREKEHVTLWKLHAHSATRSNASEAVETAFDDGRLAANDGRKLGGRRWKTDASKQTKERERERERERGRRDFPPSGTRRKRGFLHGRFRGKNSLFHYFFPRKKSIGEREMGSSNGMSRAQVANSTLRSNSDSRET